MRYPHWRIQWTRQKDHYARPMDFQAYIQGKRSHDWFVERLVNDCEITDVTSTRIDLKGFTVISFVKNSKKNESP